MACIFGARMQRGKAPEGLLRQVLQELKRHGRAAAVSPKQRTAVRVFSRSSASSDRTHPLPREAAEMT